MNRIIKNDINFNNVPTTLAIGFTGLITNNDNVLNKKYNYDPDSDPIISALDINWCGAEIAPGVSINTTDELIKWIKEKSINDEQKLLLNECKDLLTIIKDYLIRNNLDNLNKRYYWYAGAQEITESTYPGESINWHLISGKPTSIETGEQVSETKINWILAIPTALDLNHISNGALDVTSGYEEKIVMCADGVEYKVFTQISQSKKTDRIFN